MLHGFGDTGDMWAPLAKALYKDHTVVIPDLRGMGLSSHPAGGYDKKTQGRDVAAIMDKLGVAKAQLVTHDIRHTWYALRIEYGRTPMGRHAPLPALGRGTRS